MRHSFRVIGLTLGCILVSAGPFPARAGFGLGSPTDLSPRPGGIVLRDVTAHQGTYVRLLDGEIEVDVPFSMRLLSEPQGGPRPVNGPIQMVQAAVWYLAGGQLRILEVGDMDLPVDLGCAPLAGRFISYSIVDPDGDGDLETQALIDWIEAAPCP